MKLSRAKYEIIQLPDEGVLKMIEKVARTCYKSEYKITEDDSSAKDLVQKLLNRGHYAMIEFADMTIKFTVDRGVSHELVRHRLCSFAQESTRYCNYKGGVEFIIPQWMPEYLPDDDAGCGTDDIWWETYREIKDPKLVWLNSMQVAENNYLELLNKGWSPQQARSVLPNSLKTEINMKANFREWREIFKQRVAEAAHPQMREVMRPLLDEIKTKVPLIFDDINY